MRVRGKTKERGFKYHNVWGKKKIESAKAKVTVTSAAGENRIGDGKVRITTLT